MIEAPPRRPMSLQLKTGLVDHGRHRPARAARALDRAASLGHDLDAHAVPAAQCHLLVRHRRVWPRRAEPPADGNTALARHGRERDAGQPRRRRTDGPRCRLFPRLDRRGADAACRRADGRAADHARPARARGHAACPVEDGARGRLRLYSADRAAGAQRHAVARQRGLHPGREGARGKHFLHPVSRDPAERLAAADRGGQPARHLRDPAWLGARASSASALSRRAPIGV